MNNREREIYDRYAYDKTFKYIWWVYSEFERRVNNTLDEFEGLKRGECRFDYANWEKRLDLSHWQMNKAIKTLVKDEIIEQRIKGKKGTQSTYFLTRFNSEFDQQKKQQNYQQKEQQNKTSNINALDDIYKQKEQQKDKQKNVHSSIYNNLNIISNNNINTSLELKNNSNKQSKVKKDKYSEDSKEYKLSILLRDLILERDSNSRCRNANIQSWSKYIDLLHRKDNRSYEDIENIIKWSQQDNFWKSNILSTQKLREKFDTLYQKYNSGQASHNNINSNKLHDESEKDEYDWYWKNSFKIN